MLDLGGRRVAATQEVCLKRQTLSAVLAILFIFGDVACSSSKPVQPIWSDDDLEAFKIKRQYSGDDVRTALTLNLRPFTMEFSKNPPFYAGPQQLSCVFYVFSTGLLVSQKCETFENDFIYSESFKKSHPELKNFPQIPAGARTRDDSGNLVAEARLVGTAPHDKATPEDLLIIEEFHYKPCNGQSCLIFKSTSVIDGSGFKIREIESTGHKKRDYFFIWPLNYG